MLSVFFVYIKFIRVISLHTTLDHIIDMLRCNRYIP